MFNYLSQMDLYVNNLRKSAQSADRINKISVNLCPSVSNFLPTGMAYAIGSLVSSWYLIPYYSYMTLPPRNLRTSAQSADKNNKIRANLCNLRINTVNFVNFFMQNKANFKNAKITLIPYMTKEYAKICTLLRPKNKAKTKPNKAKSNPILTPLNTKQTQTNPIQTQFSVNLGNYAPVLNEVEGLQFMQYELLVTLPNYFSGSLSNI